MIWHCNCMEFDSKENWNLPVMFVWEYSKVLIISNFGNFGCHKNTEWLGL